MLFTYISDVDEHLSMLEDVDGYLFNLSAFELSSFNYKPFFHRVERTILRGDKLHTVLIFEEPPLHLQRYLRSELKGLGKKIDNRKCHQIHIFYIPSMLFNLMLEEITDWD